MLCIYNILSDLLLIEMIMLKSTKILVSLSSYPFCCFNFFCLNIMSHAVDPDKFRSEIFTTYQLTTVTLIMT